MSRTAPPRLTSRGNEKTGRAVLTFSIPAGQTCPGASSWCAQNCYAKKGRFQFGTVAARYEANREAFNPEQIIREASKAKALRVHVSGDFHSEDYVRDWIGIAEALPHVRFWAYTRSWMTESLRPVLEELRSLPNFTLWASCDPTMPEPPAGWRTAWIETDDRKAGPICPQQAGKIASCLACGLCFRSKLKKVVFKVH